MLLPFSKCYHSFVIAEDNVRSFAAKHYTIVLLFNCIDKKKNRTFDILKSVGVAEKTESAPKEVIRPITQSRPSSWNPQTWFSQINTFFLCSLWFFSRF